MPITSGSIKYERRLPRDDANTWNYKHAVAEIHWVVDLGEDEDVLAASAAEKVVTRVMQVIRWKPAVPSEVEPKQQVTHITLQNLENIAAPNLAAQHAAAEITAGIPPALKRHRRTKAEMEAARVAAAAGDPVGPGPLACAAEANPTPLASSEPISGGEPGMPETAITRSNPPIEPGMPSFDPDPAPPAEVTDMDLQNACQARASGGLPSARIRELVASFSPGGLVQTPQDARHRFLEELAKL